LATAAAQSAAIAGFVLVSIFVLAAIFAPHLAPSGPRDQNLDLLHGHCCPGRARPLVRVDPLGRDEFSRVLYGARYSR
jgi:peptide/nickel transport system permease protein